ncbi:DUF819 domain-containing protein [Maricaulis sp.]|uniref:DUF819 family protein n=1 Tax=Maricaulis sp. TaxID=1486257 RepID=UPI002B269DEF|nr:DUF819 family protein [Maricaulis sp.]
MSLIPADNAVASVAALFGVAAAGFLMEKTRIGALLTGAVWAILFAILASNIGLIPQDSEGYSFVFRYFVPILIPLFLMKADLRKIFFETGRMFGAFMLAAAGTVIGAVVAFSLISLPDYETGVRTADMVSRESGAVGAFIATYIGGSVNYAALIDITGLAQADPDFVSSATAVDNLFSGLFLALLAVLPGVSWIASRFVKRDHSQGDVAAEETGKVTAATLAYSVTFALVVVALGDLITAALANQFGPGADNWRYAIITVLALIPATAFPQVMARLHGGYEVGVALSFVFFAAIAAGADVVGLVQTAPVLIAIIGILLLVHGVVVFGIGSLLRFSLPELITASNAAILGATTAPALAAAKGWKDLVTPGVLVGVVGYALGTMVATVVFQIWPG